MQQSKSGGCLLRGGSALLGLFGLILVVSGAWLFGVLALLLAGGLLFAKRG